MVQRILERAGLRADDAERIAAPSSRGKQGFLAAADFYFRASESRLRFDL